MTECCDHENHPDHSTELKRLNRVGGQVDGVKKMIEDGRYCPDIMIQIKAIRSALKSVEANILERHLASCVTDAIKSGTKKQQDKKIEEIKELFKKFED